MKGDAIVSGLIKTLDEKTGVEVIRLSDNVGDTYHPYFTQPLIDNESSYIIASSNRTGKWQNYKLSLTDGKMTQITEALNLSSGASCLDKKNHIVYFFDERCLKSVRLSDMSEEEHLTVPEGFRPGILSITNDGEYLAFVYREEIEAVTNSSIIYSSMRESLFRRPTSVIIRYEVKTKNTHAVWGEREWISHVNIHPTDPNIILFCHEGNWHMVQRMWIAKVATDEIYPLVTQKYNLEKVGHEFFTAGGSIGAQYSCRNEIEDSFSDALQGDIYINADNTNKQIYYYPYTRPSHIQLNFAEDMAVGDEAHIRRGMNGDERNYVSLIKYGNHRADIALLCGHFTSWKKQSSHPHPIFTPNDKYVIFSSDTGGNTNIYMAEANWDKAIKWQ